MIGCNVCHCTEDNFEEPRKDLTFVKLGVYCLQQDSSWSDGPEFNLQGWSIFHTIGSPSVTVLPSELGVSVGWSGPACMHYMGMLGNIDIISTYMPDVEKTLEEYLCAIEKLSAACSELLFARGFNLSCCRRFSIRVATGY